MAIRDDRTRAFTVTFKKLQKQDTAWYWCSAGQQKISVHLLVTSQPTTIVPFTSQTFQNLLPTKPITWESWSSHSPMLAPVVFGSSIIVLMIVAILVIKFTKLNSMLRMPFDEWTRGARQAEIVGEIITVLMRRANLQMPMQA
ncbi:hypothetical protein CHARACLAT_025232 [Characodon lateralis]|uniref:Immunoglobulin V-set domain-containing protein n=1 Tax=Characodon lateralis TaxID=208331 RepID=A0ABU7F5Z2_9TELE|nr:hypothetical protein [Characodon lateralis]